MGDFNIHADEDSQSASAFVDKLEGFDFKQCVTLPTHNKGHTLDVSF